MADLRADTDRGQLVLVTGIAIAVALLALVLLLNTAIYTQNLATRDAAVGDNDALEYRNTVVDASREIIDAENDAEYGSYDKVQQNVSSSVDRTDALLTRRHAEHGTNADIEDSSKIYHEGRLVRQNNSSRQFTNETGASDWVIATGVSDARKVSATVDRSGLNNSTSDGFHIALNDSTDEWHAYVYEDDSSNEIAVAVKNASDASSTTVCQTAAAEATVDFTAGTLAGESCPGLEWGNGLSGSYDIEYRNGDTAAGTYNMTLNVSTVNGDSLNSGPDATSPYAVPAVYSAIFSFTYETSDVRYADTVRIAPGEPNA